MGEPFRQSAENAWQDLIVLNDLKVKEGESQECDGSRFPPAQDQEALEVDRNKILRTVQDVKCFSNAFLA